MNNVEKTIQKIHKNKKIGLMTHVVVGYPNLKKTEELILLMVKNGVDFIELQIPFSDPLADGTTIMKACESALQNGTHTTDAFNLVRNLRKTVKIPLFFMCYYNTVFHYGTEQFCKDAKLARIDGLIVPDMPLDEEKEEHFYAFAKKYNLTVIHVISPASTKERLEKIAKSANGFIYATARQGITGVQKNLHAEIEAYLDTVRKYITIPIAVGFGISRKEHIQALIGKADIAVVGSKVVDMIHNSSNYKKDIGDFVKKLNVLK